MKKFLKVLGGILIALILIVVGAFFWLFSSSGNAFLKNKITQIANEQAPIGLEFTHFKLGFSDYAFAITDKQKSQIALSGDYSLFTLNTNAKINAVVKDLTPYETLLGMKLNGGVSINGDVVKKSNDLEVKADIKAFNSAIEADVSLKDYKPKRLFITSKEGINVESLLTFLNQPKYAKGRILLNADMDISNLAAPSGGFQIASNAISPNIALLEKTYGLHLPNDPLTLAINGEAKGDSIATTLLANASYLNVKSQNLNASLKDFSTNGTIVASTQNIGFNTFMLKTPLTTTLNLKSSTISNQEATLALQAVSNPILAHIAMPNYTPKTIQVNAKDLSLQELLKLASSYVDTRAYAVNGTLNLDAVVDKINLKNLSYTLKGQLNSVIESLRFQDLNLAQNNHLKADINGDSKALKVNANSDLFDSSLNANAQLHNNALSSVRVDIEHLNVEKLAKMLQYDAQGTLNAKVDLKNFKDSNFDGTFSAQSPSITLSKATLNALSGMHFKKDLAFALDAEGKLNGGNGNATLTLKGDSLNAEIKNAKINLAKNAYSADFNFNTKEIANINPLDLKLKGALSLNGSVALANNKPSLSLQNRDFGELDAVLKDEKLLVKANNIDIKKIATFMDYEKILKGGIANLNVDLPIKGDDAKTIIQNLNGTAELNAHDLEIYSLDIDALARSYENANSVNLLDIGAFVLAGPLGLAATKGTDVGSLGLNSLVNTKSVIKNLRAQFTLKNGIANASDVAFVTGKTRIAAKGAINLNNNAFNNFEIALLEANNCAKYSQKIKGTLDKPKIETTAATVQTAVNLANSLLGKLTKGSKTIATPVLGKQEEKCVPFYHGSVKHPTK